MIFYIKKVLRYFKVGGARKYSLVISIIFFILSWVFSILHYRNVYYGNDLVWISWLVALVAFFCSFLPRKLSFKNVLGLVKRPDILLAIIVAILYMASHLWNFSTAPWNEYGLFDDAAWDIYFAKNHIFSNSPFQAAFFDEVGYISREVVFHYYISAFFKLFGYNLLVFNVSLLVLGFVTVLFTTFIIHRMFGDIRVTLLSAAIINFFPLHYLHIFMGHRYAIAAPLMVVSMYYLYSSFTNTSFVRAFISALFAAFCWGSAVMGKQYILGLALAVLFVIIFGKRWWRVKKNVAIPLVWFFGFIVSATPLLVYIIFNYDLYVIREKGLLHEFFSLYRSGGFLAIKPYVDQVIELFFAEFSFKRQFIPDFVIIPLPYYLYIIPGFFLALISKRFEVIFLSLIPVLGILVSGSYDFRVLLAVPLWVISIAFSLNYIFSRTCRCSRFLQKTLIVLTIFGILIGLIPSLAYLWRVSRDPNYIHYLPHKDVVVSRLIQDIVVGSSNPTGDLKRDEFNRGVDFSGIRYDTLACPYSSYAIMHLYLQDYDDKKILSFCNQGIQMLKTSEEIRSDNINAIQMYRPSSRDLKLVWEVSDRTDSIIDTFSKYRKYGFDEILSGVIDHESYSLYILTIKSEYIVAFQNEVVNQVSSPTLLIN